MRHIGKSLNYKDNSLVKTIKNRFTSVILLRLCYTKTVQSAEFDVLTNIIGQRNYWKFFNHRNIGEKI